MASTPKIPANNNTCRASELCARPRPGTHHAVRDQELRTNLPIPENVWCPTVAPSLFGAPLSIGSSPRRHFTVDIASF